MNLSDTVDVYRIRQLLSKKRTLMLDPILNLRIADQEHHRLLVEVEPTSEARRSAPAKPPTALPFGVWLTRLSDTLIRLGMKLKTRPGAQAYRPGLKIG